MEDGRAASLDEVCVRPRAGPADAVILNQERTSPRRVGPAGDRVDGIAHQLGLRAGNFSDDLITSIDDAIAGGVIHPLLTVDAHFDRRGRYTVRARIYV